MAAKRPSPIALAAAFCEHRRVRTTCPACKPARAAPEVELPSGRPEPVARAGEDVAPALRGPGKPLRPQRRRVRRATREEAEAAEAWWVRRG